MLSWLFDVARNHLTETAHSPSLGKYILFRPYNNIGHWRFPKPGNCYSFHATLRSLRLHMLQAWEIIFFSAIQQNQTLKMPQVWKLLLFSCHTKIAETAHSPSLGKPTLFQPYNKIRHWRFCNPGNSWAFSATLRSLRLHILQALENLVFYTHTTKSDTEDSAILEIPKLFLQH